MSLSANELEENVDLYTYEYFLLENVCRMCWNNNAERELTLKSSSNSETTISLADKILECLDIDVTLYSNPKKVCRCCCIKIEEFHEFKRLCKETDRKLRYILQGGCDDVTENKNSLPVLPSLVKDENIDNFLILDGPDSIDNFFDDIQHLDDCSNNKQPVCLKQRKVKTKQLVTVSRHKVNIKKKFLIKHSPTYCNICHLNLECEKKFSLHNTEHHGIEETGLFKCFGCEKRFKSRKSRTSHEVNFCKGLKDGYKCDICGRYLPKRSTYEFHMRDHRENNSLELPEDMFKCKKCLKLFRTKEHLNEHMAAHNTIKKNFVCDACGRVFTRQDYLHKHMLLHAGIKRHSCPHCDFKATQRSTLTVHIRKHTGERPYSCDMCPQRCISSSNLRAHRKRHLGDKKYECKICNRKFGYKTSLDEHVSSTHERSELHPCELCGATYTRVRGLRRHLAAKHGKPEKPNSASKSAVQIEESNLVVEVATETEANVEGNKVDSILKHVRGYERKEGENVLLIKDQGNAVFVVDG